MTNHQKGRHYIRILEEFDIERFYFRFKIHLIYYFPKIGVWIILEL